MKEKMYVILAVALVLTVFVSGCVMTGETQQVTNQEEAADAVSDISSDIEGLSSDLEDLEGLFEK